MKRFEMAVFSNFFHGYGGGELHAGFKTKNKVTFWSLFPKIDSDPNEKKFVDGEEVICCFEPTYGKYWRLIGIVGISQILTSGFPGINKEKIIGLPFELTIKDTVYDARKESDQSKMPLFYSPHIFLS